jgi:hypothetical protein
MSSATKSTMSNWSATMLAHRRFLSLALLLMIGTGAVLAASALVFAQESSG